MKRFLAGVALGLVVGGSAAYAAGVYGSGYLVGWTLEKDGEEICSDPYVWSNRTIECE